MRPPSVPIPIPLSRNVTAPGWLAACRGAALGLCLLMTLNLTEVFVFGTDAVHNWISDFRPLNQSMGITVLAMSATALLLFAMHPPLPGPVWLATLAMTGLVCAACGRELWVVKQSVPQALQVTAMARPLGIIMLTGVAMIGVLLGRSMGSRGRSSFVAILFSAMLTVAAFVLVSTQSGGISDPIPDDSPPLTVVLGEPLTEDGDLSDILRDRLRTVIAMQKPIQNTIVIFGTAKPAEDAWLAELLQDNDESNALLPDISRFEFIESPVNAAEVIAAIGERPELGEDRRVFVVAHWYQLHRLRLLARRAKLDVTAVAAEQTHAVFNQNLLVAKEAAAVAMTLADAGVQFVKSFVQAR